MAAVRTFEANVVRREILEEAVSRFNKNADELIEDAKAWDEGTHPEKPGRRDAGRYKTSIGAAQTYRDMAKKLQTMLPVWRSRRTP